MNQCQVCGNDTTRPKYCSQKCERRARYRRNAESLKLSERLKYAEGRKSAGKRYQPRDRGMLAIIGGDGAA